ncbi:MAG: GntR family transcriptional regulator [Candidatus Delongbacteria bacterium]
MQQHWNERDPIFLQIRDLIVRMVLGDALKTEEQLPSVRQVAAEYAVNPITVMKAYQLLADEGVLEKRRGLGMFIQAGARERLLAQERKQFLEVEWPRIRQRIQALGLSTGELLAAAAPAAPAVGQGEGARHA